MAPTITSGRADHPDNRALHLDLDGTFTALLRPMVPKDRPLIARAIRELTSEARQMRFVSGFSEAPEPLLDILSDVDGDLHIAWGALDTSGAQDRPIAAVHAIRYGPGADLAEVACTVLDEYQGRGLARALMAAVFHDCLRRGITTASAEVLPRNIKARHLFEGLGARLIGVEDLMCFRMDVAEVLQVLHRPDAPFATTEMVAYLSQWPSETGQNRD
ncbi:MAG: GNAT family N-acetyltransferase [Marinibacterium sp.]|nr:GNAT family N-acetyltransferase [Marinibacterium sp.]